MGNSDYMDRLEAELAHLRRKVRQLEGDGAVLYDENRELRRENERLRAELEEAG